MNRLGFFSILTLVALRLCIGWHFFKEGSDKVQSGKFTAAGFLGSATGPLAGYYHDMVWDYDGAFRLDEGRTTEAWRDAANAFERRYRLAAEQKEEVQRILDNHAAQLHGVLEANKGDIEEYQLGRERIESLGSDPTRQDVASLRGQRSTITTEWKGKGSKALREVDQVWKNLEATLNAMVNRGRPFQLPKPRLGLMDTTIIDRVIPYFDLAVGACLILGFLVRPAAIAGGLFLVSVVLSQFPGWPDAQPTYYQAIEAVGMFVLAAVGAGHFAGLDFIIFGWLQRRKAKRAQTKPVPAAKPAAA